MAFKISSKFALCLPSSSEDIYSEYGSGNIFIGGGPYYLPPYTEDVSKLLIKTPLLINPVSTAPVYAEGDSSDEYFIDVNSIRIDGKDVPFNTSLLSIDKNGVGGTKFSTITAYTKLHSSIYKPLVNDFIKKAESKKMKRVKTVAHLVHVSVPIALLIPPQDRLCRRSIWCCKETAHIGGFTEPIQW